MVLADTTVSISFVIFDKHPQILCGMCLQIKSCASVGLEKQEENLHYLWENCHKQLPWIKNKMKQTKKQLSLWNNLLQFNLLLLVIFMLIQAQSATLIACWICIQLFTCAFVFRFRNESYRWLLTLLKLTQLPTNLPLTCTMPLCSPSGCLNAFMCCSALSGIVWWCWFANYLHFGCCGHM